MKALYVGILTPGTTSRMRAEVLRDMTPGWDWIWIDTDVPFRKSNRLWRSVAFRTVSGPAVSAINGYVLNQLPSTGLSLAWVDKGIFLLPQTVEIIRRAAGKLVHYTPDTAFHTNRSRHFERALPLYDLAVTTKSFEEETYATLIPRERLHRTTQAYDSRIHFPRIENRMRRVEAVFIGLCEPDRERCMTALVNKGIPLRLGGKGWTRFLRRFGSEVSFVGESVFGDSYAELLSGAWVGLGLLSKRFPELHTTRTFEIPACGTILATEKTSETETFFNEDEALFFSDYDDLASRLHNLLGDEDSLSKRAAAGRARVLNDGRDYASILRKILTQLHFPVK